MNLMNKEILLIENLSKRREGEKNNAIRANFQELIDKHHGIYMNLIKSYTTHTDNLNNKSSYILRKTIHLNIKKLE